MDFDAVVVGGGLVGSACAAALGTDGLRLALIEPAPPAPPPAEGWDTRIYAVSPGSAAFLAESGAWQRLDAARVQPVYAMEVFGDDGRSRLGFSAYEAGLPELAFILESRLLAGALWETLAQAPGVERFFPARCAALEWGADAVTVTLADGTKLRTRLVVGADGAESWVRAQAGIAAEPRPYGQLGVVANFETTRPHEGVARQWFRADGVVALLPLPGERVSLVWSAPEEEARALLAAEPAALCARVAAATQGAGGELKLLNRPAGFPLRLLRPPTCIGARLALIGDAAHLVHPLAGQGVNLGFRDARELAAVLRGRGPQPDCGHAGLLRRYERARKEDVLAVQLLTDGLNRLFQVPHPGAALARNWGLELTHALLPLKNLLLRHAVG